MLSLLVFASLLVVAVLVSERASRSILSTAIVFLAGGVVAGNGWLGLVSAGPGDASLQLFAELALFSVLFTDGMKTGFGELASAWRLPGRALLFGMPLTLLITAFLAHALTGIVWMEAFLVAAVLAPTDPVFAAAIVGREEVPGRLRYLLNVESGLNDGLALPAVLFLLALTGGQEVEPGPLLGELGLGVAIGVLIPWVLIRLEARPLFSAYAVYEPLLGVSIALLVYSLAHIIGANVYLAAFAAGITISSASDRLKAPFQEFGEVVTEILKLGAIFLFGAAIRPSFFAELGAADYLFAVLVLFAARPVALLASLAGSALGWRERVAAAWFGPKGFASVVYSLLVLQSGAARAPHLFHLLSLVIAASMVLHSSTDVSIAGWFRKVDQETPVTGEGADSPGDRSRGGAVEESGR